MMNHPVYHTETQEKEVKAQQSTSLEDKKYIIVNENTVKLLGFDTISKYIMAICQKVNNNSLDISKMIKNVYSKLKVINSAKDIENGSHSFRNGC